MWQSTKMYWNPDQSDNEDEIDEETFGGRSGIVVLVDCSESMFAENESEKSKFQECMECIEAVMLNKVISSEKDLIGIVFYNTLNSPAPKDETDMEPGPTVPKKMAIFLTMSPTSAESIKYLKSFRESDDLFDFSHKYGHSNDCNFADALWLCSRMFTRCGFKLQQTNLVLFTDTDQPHPTGSHEYQQVFVKATDYKQLDVNVILVPMADEFDGNKFYREFLCTAMGIEDQESYHLPQYRQSKDQLLQRIFRRDFKKRCLLHMKMSLSENIQFAVNVYSFNRKNKYPQSLTLLRDTNAVIITKKSHMIGTVNEETDTIEFNKHLLPGDQRKVQFFGNEKISFSTEEITNMKQMLAPGIKLLGFKPISKFSVHNHLRSSLFLYPDESTVKGSTVMFRALWEKCLSKGKAAYCLMTMRRKSPPKLVALIPQENVLNDSEICRYNGFRVEFIPYAADIRNLDVFDRPAPEVEQENVELFQKIVKKIKFKFNPFQFENPVLHTMYANIEALVFGTDGKAIEDCTMPDIEYQDRKIEPFFNVVTEVFGKDELSAEKRKPAATGAPKAKQAKLEGGDPVDANHILNSISNGTGDKLLVSTLKAYLSTLGIPGTSKLNKAGLIEKIKAHHNL